MHRYRESSCAHSRTQHTAYVRRSEGMVVVCLLDHFTATPVSCSGYVSGSRDPMPRGTEKHVVDAAGDLLFNGVVGG
jgi:hypothetical protein